MTCGDLKGERDVVRLIQDFDLLGADCERLEKEAVDEAAIGIAKAAAQNVSMPSAVPATGVPEAMMVDVSKYVTVPFTGTGELQTLLQEFRNWNCLLYTSPSPRDRQKSRMPSSA